MKLDGLVECYSLPRKQIVKELETYFKGPSTNNFPHAQRIL